MGNFDDQYSTIKTTYGKLELDSDTGEFRYTMDEPKLVEGDKPNAIMALGKGQSVTETYTVRVTDSHGSWTEKNFEITITGTNDRPEITSTDLKVHGTEDKAVDEDYHPEQGDLSIELVDAREYDNNDSIEGYYFVDTQDGENVSEGKASVEITVEQLRTYLEEHSDALAASSDSSKVELKARLDALDDGDVIATLKVETVDGKGKLTLEPNQDSSFIQALNANDKLTLELSELCGMYVSAKDTHNAYADGVDVTLVLHGKNDAQTSISADAPTVKEEGVYCVGDNGNIPTQIHEGTDSEIGYTQHRTSSKGEFTISDRDAGQITFTYKNDFTDNHEKEFKEAGTTIGENAVSYEQESEGAETYYVFGTYGYYEISLTSSLDVDQGEKTFDYTYYLYSEETPETIQDQFGDDFDDRLTAVNSIPQSERVEDTVELTVKTEDNLTSLTLNATVVGSNDVPVIEDVAEVQKPGATPLDIPEDGALGPNTMKLVEEGGEKTLHITLQSSETGEESQFVGKIIGNDPDLKAEDYLELPEYIEDVVPVELDAAARKAYKKLEREALLQVDGATITAGTAAVLNGKLLQLCSGAVYDTDGRATEIHTCKVEAFLETVERLNGQHALVFYWYRHELERLWKALAPSGLRVRVYTGEEDERAWNAGEVDLLMAHPASCGYGLNLQAGGHHMIWFGLPNWTLEVYQQACKRLHRQGQQFPVVSHLLVVQGGMDQAVVAALQEKGDAQEALMQALKAKIEEVKRGS